MTIMAPTDKKHSFSLSLVIVLLGTLGLCAVARGQSNEPVERFEPVFDYGVLVRPAHKIPGITDLMEAAAAGNLRRIDELLETGVNINAIDINGRTALSNAAGAGYTPVVRHLIDRQADLGIVARDGNTALSYAVRYKHRDIVIALLDGGANPNGTSGSLGQSLLAYAAVVNEVRIVEALIAAGADITSDGALALNNAIWKGHAEIIDSLFATDVDVSARIHDDTTLLHTAAKVGNLSAVQRLLDKGANVDAENRHGQTPLLVAVAGGRPDVATLLVRDGKARVSAADVEAALSQGLRDVSLALASKLRPGISSAEEFESLLLAAERAGHESVVILLLELDEEKFAETQEPTLVFVKSTSVSCSISWWKPLSDKQGTFYSEHGECTVSFFLEGRSQTIFVVGTTSMQALSIRDRRSLFYERLPVDLMEEAGLELQRQWAEYFGQGNSTSGNVPTLRVTSMGFLNDGDLAFVASAWDIADGIHSHLFVRSGSIWTVPEKQACHRFESYCGFDKIDGRALGHRPNHYAVWHPSVRLNRYFVSKTEEIDPDKSYDREPIWKGAVRFQIDGEESTLRYRTRESGHCADDCLYTLDLSLQVGDDDPASVTDYPGAHWIVDRYLLVRGGREGNVKLIDLGTGDEIYSDLHSAAWVF